MQESLPAESLQQDTLYLWVLAMCGLQQFPRDGLLSPRTGEPERGLRTLTPLGEPLQYNYFHLWVTHPAGLGLNYIAQVPLLPFHCGLFCVWM